MIILFIYCCVTNHPTLGSIRQQTLIISPSFLRVRNLRVASLYGSSSRLPTSCCNLKVSLALKSLLQVHLCGCWQASVPHWLWASHLVSYHLDSSTGLLIIRQLPFSKVRAPKERQRVWQPEVSSKIRRLMEEKKHKMTIFDKLHKEAWNSVAGKRKSLTVGNLLETAWGHPSEGKESKRSLEEKQGGFNVWMMSFSRGVSLWARERWNAAAVWGLLWLQDLSYLGLAGVECIVVGYAKQAQNS